MDNVITIAEVAQKLGVSKVTIYNKLKVLKDKIKNNLTEIENIKYIDNQGFNLIKESLNLKEKLNQKELKNVDINIIISFKDETINLLKLQIDDLKTQLNEKDNQIKTLNRLMENNQILLKDSQKTVLLLEDKKKSFWDKFFKKN